MNGTPRSTPGSAPVIQLENASFGYADRRVLSGVTLSVEPGEVVAVLGPNGSGKSTLVRGLLGLTERLGGTVRLFGEPADKFDQHWRIGYVPQRHTLSASVRATVREIVAVGRLTRHRWWKPFWHKATDSAIVDRELEVVGLADRAGTDVATLSGGQQRRVLIARALASEPDVLLMDEPTAGVDTANQEVLAQVLAKLAARGTTMLIVTHELEALEDVVTRIVVVRAGRIAFDGTPEEFHSGDDHTRADHHHNGHHHDDELDPDHHPDPGRHPLPGAPGAGPLDPRRRTTP